MNDFLDCCGPPCPHAERLIDARLEADRLRAEVARLARERDEAKATLRDMALSAELLPFPVRGAVRPEPRPYGTVVADAIAGVIRDRAILDHGFVSLV